MPAPFGEPIFCPTCGYDLRANTSGRCPECGGDVFDQVMLAALVPWQFAAGFFRRQ